jgi:hypothetical protein
MPYCTTRREQLRETIVRDNRPVGIGAGCVTIVCLGLLLWVINVLQGNNRIIVIISSVVFIAFAFYIVVRWVIDAFKGPR